MSSDRPIAGGRDLDPVARGPVEPEEGTLSPVVAPPLPATVEELLSDRARCRSEALALRALGAMGFVGLAALWFTALALVAAGQAPWGLVALAVVANVAVPFVAGALSRWQRRRQIAALGRIRQTLGIRPRSSLRGVPVASVGLATAASVVHPWAGPALLAAVAATTPWWARLEDRPRAARVVLAVWVGLAAPLVALAWMSPIRLPSYLLAIVIAALFPPDLPLFSGSLFRGFVWNAVVRADRVGAWARAAAPLFDGHVWGRALRRTGALRQAWSAHRRALAFSPDRADVAGWLEVVDLLAATGDERALAVCEDVCRAVPAASAPFARLAELVPDADTAAVLRDYAAEAERRSRWWAPSLG